MSKILELSDSEISTLLAWFDDVRQNNNPVLFDDKHWELKDRLKKLLLGY